MSSIKKRITGLTMSSSIPDEIYRDIFLRLPMKSILASKFVCRNWYAIVKSPDFVKTHISIHKNNPVLILEREGTSTSSNKLYTIGYDSLASSVCEFQDEAIQMDYPLIKSGYGVRLLSSCNGLVSIWLFDNNSNWPIPWNFICFWNPATREYKELPKPPNPFDLDHVLIHAFSYDHKTDDYKFAIGVKARREDGTLFQVYTLSSNSWKIGKAVPYSFGSKKSGVLVNGDLHWLTRAHGNSLVLSLDISNESFKEMQLPKEFFDKHKQIKNLGVLDGCLSVLAHTREYPDMEVWVMLDYGVSESWAKRHVIADSNIRRQFRTQLAWSFKNGEILLLSGSSHDFCLVLHDPKHGSTRKLQTDDILFINALNYFESLVSLNSDAYAGEQMRSAESVEP